MRVTALKLVFEGHAAADIQQGMVCALTIAILGPHQDSAGGHQQDEIRKLRIAPASFVVQDHAILCVKLEVAIGVDERVSLTVDGHECGSGDAVYLASWSGQATRQSFMDDAKETAYVLSHGDAAAGDACLVEVLLHQAEDAGKNNLHLYTSVLVRSGCVCACVGGCIVAEPFRMMLYVMLLKASCCGSTYLQFSEHVQGCLFQGASKSQCIPMSCDAVQYQQVCRCQFGGCGIVQMISHQAHWGIDPS